ncbi:MAG: hypothetical protein QOJ65_2010 [Fimbriimonadaceae bacterium]|jgi:ribosomal protein S18 acetylase RimI-like enzyme|nr:hypothetical protein [Fimbriimonadaceae bacterium]
MEILPPLHLSLDALADDLTACFEGYIMPVQFTSQLLAGMIRVDSIDLASSYVGVEGDRVIGAILVARRDKVSRIAAMGIVASARRQGLGKKMLYQAIEDCKGRGDRRLVLEVIEQNPAAIFLYESVRFTIEWRLLGFNTTLRATPHAAELQDASLQEVAAAIRTGGDAAASWSMSAASVEQMALPNFGARCGDAYGVLGLAGEEVLGCRSMGFAAKPNVESAKQWIAALATKYPGRKLRMPAFFPEPVFGEPLTGAGMERDEISQFQMAMRLRD